MNLHCSKACSVSNCVDCDLNALSTCLICETGYLLANNVCTKNVCITGCTLCDNNGVCLKCTDSYSLFNSVSKICEIKCSLENCKLCKPKSLYC